MSEFARVFEEFKALADKKKELYDGDIEALVLQAEHRPPAPGRLENLHVVSDSTRFADGPRRAASHAMAARSR